MKIVINVPDYVKEQADDGKGAELGIPLWLAYEIANGTPLPEHHGRLIDAEWLKFALHNFFYGLKRPVDEEDIQRYIDVARSIIEADKAESEE